MRKTNRIQQGNDKLERGTLIVIAVYIAMYIIMLTIN